MKFKFFKHLFTITHHRHLVIKHCFKLGIGFQGLFHDLSKYGLTEFVPGVKYYDGLKSPTENERDELGYSKAWMHHKSRNKHHIEYWFDINSETKRYEPVEIPIKYLKEMFADRIAASKTYLKDKYTDKSPYDYFITHIAIHMMNKKSSETMLSWLEMLKDKGEKETFKYIRNIK